MVVVVGAHEKSWRFYQLFRAETMRGEFVVVKQIFDMIGTGKTMNCILFSASFSLLFFFFTPFFLRLSSPFPPPPLPFLVSSDQSPD